MFSTQTNCTEDYQKAYSKGDKSDRKKRKKGSQM